MTRTIGAVLAAMAVTGMAAPAAAGDRRPGRHHHHRDRNKVDVGDVVASAVIIGAVAALFGKKKARPAPVDVAYVPPAAAMPIAALTDEDASTACGDAAEAEGSRLARVARVTQVTTVDAAGEGWIVKGQLQLRDGYRDMAGSLRSFRCAIGATGTPTVHFDGDGTAEIAAR